MRRKVGLKKQIDEHIPLNGIQTIDLKIIEGYITIYETDQKRLEITGSIGNCTKDIEIKTNGNYISIHQKIRKSPMNFGGSNLYIGIPASYKENLTVIQTTGRLTIRDVNLASLYVESKVAKLKINDIMFQHFILKNGNRSCDVVLKRKIGTIKIYSFVGKVNLSLEDIGGDIQITSGNMGGAIKLPHHAPIKITGDKKCRVEATTANEKYELRLHANVGKIQVRNH